MPYKRRGRTIYVKKGRRWKKKQRAKSVKRAKGALRLLRGIHHGWSPSR